MKLLDWYIIKKFLGTFFFSIVLILSIAIVFDLTEKMDDFFEHQVSQYERALYFISFPFNVKLSEVFGFGQYGVHWVIEYYDGLTRAKNGYWILIPSP